MSRKYVILPDDLVDYLFWVTFGAPRFIDGEPSRYRVLAIPMLGGSSHHSRVHPLTIPVS